MFGEGKKSNFLKEWIIFALCLGLGAHLALGVVLHSPDLWPMNNLWWYGLLLSISFYILVQVSRSVYRLVKPLKNHEEDFM